MRRAAPVLAVLWAGAAWAVDPADLAPAEAEAPACPEGQIAAAAGCAAPGAGIVTDAERLAAARGLAAEGRAEAALGVLDTVRGDSASLHALRGRALREAGDIPASLAAYEAALARDPDHLEARSYYGQSLIAAGDPAAARDQLLEIRARGGRGTLAYRALKRALQGSGGY